MSDTDTCPECDSAKITSAAGETAACGPEIGHSYRCDACGATFDEPHRRPARAGSGGVKNGLAAKLDQADSPEGLDGSGEA